MVYNKHKDSNTQNHKTLIFDIDFADLLLGLRLHI